MVLQAAASSFRFSGFFASGFGDAGYSAPTLFTPTALSWENEATDDVTPETTATVAEVEITPEVREELELVERARKGDGGAFSSLIRRYEGKIFRLAMNITQNREDAEDVLQEAFLKAYEHLDQFQGIMNARYDALLAAGRKDHRA